MKRHARQGLANPGCADGAGLVWDFVTFGRKRGVLVWVPSPVARHGQRQFRKAAALPRDMDRRRACSGLSLCKLQADRIRCLRFARSRRARQAARAFGPNRFLSNKAPIWCMVKRRLCIICIPIYVLPMYIYIYTYIHIIVSTDAVSTELDRRRRGTARCTA